MLQTPQLEFEVDGSIPTLADDIFKKRLVEEAMEKNVVEERTSSAAGALTAPLGMLASHSRGKVEGAFQELGHSTFIIKEALQEEHKVSVFFSISFCASLMSQEIIKRAKAKSAEQAVLDRLAVDFNAITLEARIATGGFGEVCQHDYMYPPRPQQTHPLPRSIAPPSRAGSAR